MALTTDFVAAVRRQGAIQSSFASADILSAGDIEIQSRFIPLCEATRQNYFVREATVTADARGKYPIPARSIGSTLRNVQLFLNNGWWSLPQRQMELGDFPSAGALPAGYYVDAGNIVLLPNGTAGTLRVRYTARPGRMVLDTDTTQTQRITAVTPGTTTTSLTLAGAYTGSTTIDIVAAGPAHQQKAIGTTYTAPNVPTADLQDGVAVGDYIAVADRSPFVPLPEELYAALVHRTSGALLRALGYDEEAAQQLKLAEDAIQSAKDFLQPRNEGNPQQVVGGLRASLAGGRRGWLGGRWW